MNEISTAGVTLKYAAEATSGTRPTTGYTTISNVKSIGSIDPEPSTLETTDLSATVWKTYIEGLKDPGGAIEIGVNITTAFATAWEAVVTAAASKNVWFEVNVPNFKSFYFQGDPASLGMPSIEVDSVFEGSVYIVPNEIAGWAEASK